MSSMTWSGRNFSRVH